MQTNNLAETIQEHENLSKGEMEAELMALHSIFKEDHNRAYTAAMSLSIRTGVDYQEILINLADVNRRIEAERETNKKFGQVRKHKGLDYRRELSKAQHLTDRQCRLAYILESFSHPKECGNLVFPSVMTLAVRMGVKHHSSVNRTLSELEGMGLITRLPVSHFPGDIKAIAKKQGKREHSRSVGYLLNPPSEWRFQCNPRVIKSASK
ncbi:hypothetical protein [Roseibium sp.]|uniref:hypothetical protein n=1 Tax=Roseibium sp. TaxID=1936156 RepID=UPI00391B5D93